MNKYQQKLGFPYRNVTDMTRQFKFDATSNAKIYVIGQSPSSQFDMSISLSLFSTQDANKLEEYFKIFAIVFTALLVLYCICLIIKYRRKTDNKKYHDIGDDSGDEGEPII